MRRILTAALARIGHTDVVEACDGREALDRLREGPVDLIVTDWIMPEMDGIQFVRALRGATEMRALPVLMVTTHATRDHIVEAMSAGVNSYIVKPFALETLQQKIDSILIQQPTAP